MLTEIGSKCKIS